MSLHYNYSRSVLSEFPHLAFVEERKDESLELGLLRNAFAEKVEEQCDVRGVGILL